MILQVKGTNLEIEYLPNRITVWDGKKSIEHGKDVDVSSILANILDERFFLCGYCDSYQPISEYKHICTQKREKEKALDRRRKDDADRLAWELWRKGQGPKPKWIQEGAKPGRGSIFNTNRRG